MFVLAEPAITVRATTLTSPAEEAPWPDPSTASADELHLWVTHLWQESEYFARAVRVASPSLAGQLDRVRTGEVGELGRLRRCAVSLMRYLIRSRSRPTPFGMFAGVAPVQVGATTQVSWGGEHQAVARPDALWLHDYAQHLTAQDRHELTVVAASTLRVSGDRLVREWLPGTTEPDEAVPISVRHTPATAMALEQARAPRPLREIEDALCSAFPSAS